MRLDSHSGPGMNGRTMETLKPFMLGFAVFWPAVVCIMLAFRVAFRRQTDWKLACCLSGLSVATSLLLLLASEKLLFLRYQEAVLQVNQKAEEVSRLTEQNKRIAITFVKAIKSGSAGMGMTGSAGGFDIGPFENVLKEAGVTPTQIDEALGRSPPGHKP